MPADTPDMVLVPREPTEAMLEAGQEALRDCTDVYMDRSEVVTGGAVNAIWSAMLSASPAREGEQDHEGIFSPFNACCYRETCRAMARAAPSPGEGEAPVAWLIPGIERDMVELDGSPVVSEAKARGFEVRPLFTRPTPATPEGLRQAIDWLALEAANLERSGARTYAGQGVDAALANSGARLDRERAARFRVILSALQPQAQGGE